MAQLFKHSEATQLGLPAAKRWKLFRANEALEG